MRRHAWAASVFLPSLLWRLPKPQDCFLGCWETSTAAWNIHRQWYTATGTKISHRQTEYCRSAIYTAGRHSVPAESANDSNRGQCKAWQHNSRHICTNHVPYHGNDSKGHVFRFRTTNHAFPCMMAQVIKYATFMSNEMQTNQTN